MTNVVVDLEFTENQRPFLKVVEVDPMLKTKCSLKKHDFIFRQLVFLKTVKYLGSVPAVCHPSRTLFK